MNDLLLDVPEVTPRWRELAEELEIFTINSEYAENCEWTAFVRHSDMKEMTNEEVIDAYPDYIAHFEISEKIQDAPTEREAVVGLIHRLKLPGWETVSLN